MPKAKCLRFTRLDKNNNLIATLPQGSARYTLQIPVQVMVFNPGWTQNP
jgi:hypothetical protein